MKKMIGLALAVVLCGAGFGGCTDPIAAKQDSISTYPQVHLTTHWLESWTRVQPPIIQYVGAQQMQVAVPIRNLTNDPLSLDYQYRFLRNGAEVEGRSGWHHYVVPPRGMGQISFSSIVPTANDFDLEIRTSQ